MIYFFTGENSIKSFEKGSALFQSLKAKKPDASFLSFDSENISLQVLDEMLETQGLFEKKIVALLKNILAKGDLKKEILKRVKDLKKSDNIFVWIEKDINATEEKAIVEAAEKSIVSSGDKKVKVDFNIFALSDAFGNRDKVKLWTLLVNAFEQEKSAEEIQGTLFWQAKSILLSKSEKSAEEAGLKPFSFTKSKQFSKNFSDEEIKIFTKKLVEIYHEAHLGRTNFELALEEFALSL